MRFRDLTEDHEQRIYEVYHDKSVSWDARMSILCDELNTTERTVRRWISKLGYSKVHVPESPQYEDAKKKQYDGSKQRFIFTWGQSETTPHNGFMDNLEAYADYVGASIHVIAGRYKNPTSLEASHSVRNSETWHSRLVPYLDANRHNIHRYMTIFSDVKVQPTAINPMSGMQSFSGENSCIFGAPKLHLETIPVLGDRRPKLMCTTGACTVRNYTDTKAGKKGEFHHTIGFAIVEIEDDETFYVRQVSAEDDGSFNDWMYRVADGEVEHISECAAFILGDVHCGHHDADLVDATHKIMQHIITPEHVVLHDIFDGRSINHHEDKDPFIQYGKEVRGENDLISEVEDMLDFLNQFHDYRNVVICRSNHDDFLDRWLKGTDWRKGSTPKNHRAYLEFASMLAVQHEKDDVIGVIPEIILNEYPSFIPLSDNESYIVEGWELGHHGHIGTSGSRGSLQQFRRLNSKVVVGHYHCPERKDGALSVGTTTHLRLNYNKGASRWMQSHVIVHRGGKSQHLIFERNIAGQIKCALDG